MKKLLTKELLYHILFWIIYDLQSIFSHPAEYIEEHGIWSIALKQTAGLIVLLIPFYISFFLIIPRYLSTKKFVKFYISEALLIIFGIGLLFVEASSLDWYYGFENYFAKNFVAYLPFYTSRIFFFLVISVGARFTIDWFKFQKKISKLELASKDAELKMLKYQISPHFLFNSLNNVYSLILTKSDKAEILFIKFSNLLRYQLNNDIHQDYISLEREVSYINDFIELQKIRLTNPCIISFDVSGDLTGVNIPPLLIISFIENAFKHGDTSEQSRINITIKVDNGSLIFKTENKILPKEKDTTSGIGIGNVKRRLDLIYGNDYSLEIIDDEYIYKVKLIISKL